MIQEHANGTVIEQLDCGKRVQVRSNTGGGVGGEGRICDALEPLLQVGEVETGRSMRRI